MSADPKYGRHLAQSVAELHAAPVELHRAVCSCEACQGGVCMCATCVRVRDEREAERRYLIERRGW